MDLIISHANNQPVYEQIHVQIKTHIISGKLKGGDLLPSIRSLAKELRNSVITPRCAYDELEKDGHIYSVAGKGSYVTEKNTEIIREANLKEMENHIRTICQLAAGCNLNTNDMIEMVSVHPAMMILSVLVLNIFSVLVSLRMKQFRDRGCISMKACFAASICVHGVQGGAVYLDDNGFIFRCQKATMEDKYKNLRIPYKRIKSISAGKRVLFIPTTVIEMGNGERYRFLIFRRRKFKRCIQQQLVSSSLFDKF